MIVSCNSHDLPEDVCIPVIASFSKDGHIAPLYVGIKGLTLKVDSFWVRTQFRNIVEFNCKVVEENRLKPLNLTYHRAEDIWTVSRYVME